MPMCIYNIYILYMYLYIHTYIRVYNIDENTCTLVDFHVFYFLFSLIFAF